MLPFHVLNFIKQKKKKRKKKKVNNVFNWIWNTKFQFAILFKTNVSCFFLSIFFRFMSFNVQSTQKKKRRNKHHNHKCIAFCQILFTSFKFNKNKINKWKSNQTINCFPFLSETNGFFPKSIFTTPKINIHFDTSDEINSTIPDSTCYEFLNYCLPKVNSQCLSAKKNSYFFHHLRFILIV